MILLYHMHNSGCNRLNCSLAQSMQCGILPRLEVSKHSIALVHKDNYKHTFMYTITHLVKLFNRSYPSDVIITMPMLVHLAITHIIVFNRSNRSNIK